MNQAELLPQPLNPDTYTLLRLFENYRGIDVPQDWNDLMQNYHHALDDPADKRSWSRSRLSKALDDAEAAGLVEYRKDWTITRAGLEARKAEWLRRTERQQTTGFGATDAPNPPRNFGGILGGTFSLSENSIL